VQLLAEAAPGRKRDFWTGDPYPSLVCSVVDFDVLDSSALLRLLKSFTGGMDSCAGREAGFFAIQARRLRWVLRMGRRPIGMLRAYRLFLHCQERWGAF